MQLDKYIPRLQYAHTLIQKELTGTAENFAEKLHIKKSQFYCLLEDLKFFGAKLRYDHHRKTYYYTNDFELIIDIHVLIDDEEHKLFGGLFYEKK